MTASLPRRLSTTALSLAVVALAACSESTTPFDPVALSQNTDEILKAMDDSPAVQSMDVLGDRMTTGAPAMGAPSLVAATLPNLRLGTTSFPAWAARRLAALQATLPAWSVAAPEAVIIPDLALGKTFTYNLANDEYQLSDRTGAPANGVRFILYAVNTLTHSVAEPLNEIGYVDLTDESTSTSALKLHLKAYVTETLTPLIDYTASATVQGTPPDNVTGGSVSVTGYVSDGTNQVDFDLSQTLSTTTGISVDYQLSVPEKDISVQFEARFTLTQQATVTLTIQNGGNTTVAAVSGTAASITGTIKHNGDLVVNITGSATNPVFADASGNQLTAQQIAALEKLFDFVDALQSHVDEMLAPAYSLLGLAFVFG